MERVSVRRGSNPVLFVAPHGPDDVNTEFIAENACQNCDGYYVINRGFEKCGDIVDVDDDKANCNRIDQVTQYVVKEEFLNPITKIVNEMIHDIISKYTNNISLHWKNSTDKMRKPMIFYIHGCGDHVHNIAGEKVAIIVGYGKGRKNDSLSCEEWRKNMFIKEYQDLTYDGQVYSGEGGGSYAGRHHLNMNQYYRKHEHDTAVDSMQLELPYSTRKNKSNAVATGIEIASVVNMILNHDPKDSYKSQPDLELFI